jgi:hypothetical protein
MKATIKKFKVVNENGVFEGTRLLDIILKSNSEFSKEYEIFENNVLVERVKRDLDKNGNIIR